MSGKLNSRRSLNVNDETKEKKLQGDEWKAKLMTFPQQTLSHETTEPL